MAPKKISKHLSAIRDKILRDRGLVKVGKSFMSTNIDNKTATMLRLEIKHSRPIEQMLVSGTMRQVAKLLDITMNCVWRWRKRLGLLRHK